MSAEAEAAEVALKSTASVSLMDFVYHHDILSKRVMSTNIQFTVDIFSFHSAVLLTY